MKNLKILCCLNYPNSDLRDCQKFTVGTVDYNYNVFVRKGCGFAYKDGDIYAMNSIEGDRVMLASVKEVYDLSNSPVSMFYNSIFNSLNIALKMGEVLSFSLTEDLKSIDGEAQCVGCIGSGLQDAALSPDSENIVFLDSDNTIFIMSGNFDPIHETSLLGSDQGEQEMVNVGWGKKETQFHGSEGKAAAKKKLDEGDATKLTILPEAERGPKIAWRGDSSLFAVSYWCCINNHQKIKIFNKAGSLQCTSEYLPGLEPVLSWRPSGNLIALVQQLPNKHVICFMEKNGLRHGDFTLPSNIKVLDLSWNLESTILSAVCEDEASNQPCVLLWTTGNYHWYLKQRLNLRSPVVNLCWDEVIGNLCHILLRDGSYLVYQWTWAVDHSPATTDNDLATVAVIDNFDLKLTPFKKCIIPPPMCGATVTFPSPVLQVMFPSGHSDTQTSSDICVFLSNCHLAFVSRLDTSPQLHSVVPVAWKCAEISLPSPSALSHWLWLSQHQLICVAYQDGCSHLCCVEVSALAADVVSTTLLDESVLTISHGSSASQALVQLSSGSLLLFREGSLSPLSTLPEPCLSLRVLGSHTFARAYNSHMYVDGELIASNVTSFFCLPQFLVMTLSSHQLCVTSTDTGFKVQNESENTTNRRLERGSSLVIVVGHSVVLQMPRGNLETIEPRALTLVTAGKLLDAADYKAVAQLLRRQRIDLNLCVDHNPTQFLLSVSRFVAQIRDPQWLSVFLAELSERDVTRGMYAGHYKLLSNRGPPLPDKVNRVCSALREAMTQTQEDREFYLQPILSTFVRSARVGEAIALAESDQALGYLTLLMDTDKLYEEALATYNLEKALKIAGKSLKDPKEYVAYLNELRAMEPAYMRFSIDKRLRKPQMALQNLAQCLNRADECLQYVKETSLYSLALELFKDKPEMYRQVCLLYGEHLLGKHHYHEAGLMFRRGGNVEKALSALTRAGCWRQCLTLASQHSYSESSLAELHRALYSTLHGSQQFTEAAQMCHQLGWLDKAISCCVEAHSWSEAVYLCHTHQLTDLIDSVVKPALLHCYSHTLADLRAKREQLDRHSARLQVVREKKSSLDNNFDAMSDMQSDTSSLSSFSTSSAGTRTTKNTRKAQRKLWSLKEGNPREEQALLYTITELMQNTERLSGEIHSTCLALSEFDLNSEAKGLQGAMSVMLDHIQTVKHTVWPASSVKKTGSDAEAIDPTSVDLQLSFPPASCVASSWKLHILT